MKRHIGAAVAGAVLAAGITGGAGFAATAGRDGKSSNQTNVSIVNNGTTTHNTTDASKAQRCANLQIQIVNAQLRIASAKNAKQVRALAKQIVRLQQQFQQECATP